MVVWGQIKYIFERISIMTDIEILEIMIKAIEQIEVDDKYNYETGETYYVLNTNSAVSYLYNEIDLRKSK